MELYGIDHLKHRQKDGQIYGNDHEADQQENDRLQDGKHFHCLLFQPVQTIFTVKEQFAVQLSILLTVGDNLNHFFLQKTQMGQGFGERIADFQHV